MRPILHVCVTCRAGTVPVEGIPVPGARLHATLNDALTHARDAGSGVDAHALPDIREVNCLAACGEGCTATIASAGKWRVLLGRLDETMAADLLDYARLYAASPTGMVLPSKRAASLRSAVLARIPA